MQLTKLKEQGDQQQESGGVVAELESHISELDEQLNLSQLQVEEFQHQLKQVGSHLGFLPESFVIKLRGNIFDISGVFPGTLVPYPIKLSLIAFTMQTKAKLSEKSVQIELWSARHNQATQFLMTCLEDVKDKIVTLERPPREGGSSPSPPLGLIPSPFGRSIPEPPLPDVAVLPGRLEDLSVEQRERVLSHLLERLHAFTKSQQLEAATALTSSPQQQARRGGSNSISLPSITAYPRRNAAATLPISQVSGSGPSSLMNITPMGKP